MAAALSKLDEVFWNLLTVRGVMGGELWWLKVQQDGLCVGFGFKLGRRLLQTVFPLLSEEMLSYLHHQPGTHILNANSFK